MIRATADNVRIVLQAHGIRKVSGEKLEAILDGIDHDRIEKATLRFTARENQTESAYDELEDQLIRMKIVPKGSKKFGNYQAWVAPDDL